MRCRINNAGSNAYKYGVLGDYSDAELINIVETNVLGVMLGCREVDSSAHKRKPYPMPSTGTVQCEQ